MKSSKSILITLIALVAVALPVPLAAQHTRYKLIDIGTFGGPASYLTDPGFGLGELVLNNRGMLAGKADTPVPDPNGPDPNSCAVPSCFLPHTFLWERGALTDLGTLPGGSSSDVGSINARGWISGGSTNGEIDPLTGGPVFHAVLWRNGQITDLGTLGTGLESAGAYVNDGGQVIGFSSINTTPDPFSFLGGPIHTFIWQNEVMQDVGTLGGPDALPGPSCRNERSGLVTGFSFINSTPNPDTGLPTAHPFLWDNGKMSDLGTLGGTLVCGPLDCVSCANNRGQVAGASTLAGDSVIHPFLWDHGVLKDLGTLGGDFGFVNWLNDAGVVVGGSATPGDELFHATLWRHDLIADLGTLEGDCFSNANAISSKNQIVGLSVSCDGSIVRAVLWDKGTIVDLNTLIPANSSLQLFGADNINDRGEIAGRGLPPGCDDLDACGHVFLLIPCDNDATCQGSAVTTIGVQNTAALNNRKSIASTQVLRTPMQRLAAWRARLSQRYHIRGFRAWPRD